jgi:uncharacterized membrane protein YphA (DoxX/SURF4 family)
VDLRRFESPHLPPPGGKQLGLFLATLLQAGLFMGEGLSKLFGAEFQVRSFERWLLPEWAVYVVGAVEVQAAILLLVPQVRFWGCMFIVFLMGGAIAIQVRSMELGSIAFPALNFAIAVWVAWSLRPPLLRAGPAAPPAAA